MTIFQNDKPFKKMVDFENGLIDRQIFMDESIYQMELERIFARAWNFMCHETQIPNPGDFFLTYIGEESVIATRDKEGGLQVFLNSCRHRGNAVCRAEQGNTRSFLCTYHGWTYDLQGKLIGVPGYKDLYHEQLDRAQWGLISAGKVASYKGFVFATMDADAPDLNEYLGPVGRMGLDMIAERGRGDMEIVQGIQKNIMGCNWKFAVDNLFDFYHGDISHASVVLIGTRTAGVSKVTGHRTTFGDYGHAIGGAWIKDEEWDRLKAGESKPILPQRNEEWRLRPEAQEAFGDMIRTAGHVNIFPNLWITGNQLSLRIPTGPTTTAIWWFALTPKSFDDATRKSWVFGNNHVFGPAGHWEQDDGENWDQSTRAMKGPIAQRYPLNFEMGAGRTKVESNERGVTYANTSGVTENPQRWTWKCWAEWMDAPSWKHLRDHHSDPSSIEFI